MSVERDRQDDEGEIDVAAGLEGRIGADQDAPLPNHVGPNQAPPTDRGVWAGPFNFFSLFLFCFLRDSKFKLFWKL
jgi:hypothetical protein